MSKDKPGINPRKVKITLEDNSFNDPEVVSNPVLIIPCGEKIYREIERIIKKEFKKINKDV